MIVGIVGAGAMGSGIAQVIATNGHEVRLFDSNEGARGSGFSKISQSLQKFVSKNKIDPSEASAILGRIYMCEKLDTLHDCQLVIEAIIEDLDVKKKVFQSLEAIVDSSCILATNTSSLSITSIASSLSKPERCIGIHFFNPAVLMHLVEVIPAIQTSSDVVASVKSLVDSWGKNVVLAKDTPGFIVNKVARPFYSEAIRISEEGKADIEAIDQVMVQHGFKMGPFSLMDFIGHDVNYRVTESVWKSFYYDSKYRPSFTQLRLLEAGYLGRKSGRGFYIYGNEATSLATNIDKLQSESIFMRIISMLVNEAADTVYMGICSDKDIEKAMTLGVNYPKGLLQWGKEIGYQNIIDKLDSLFSEYHEERYRVSPYLKNLAKL